MSTQRDNSPASVCKWPGADPEFWKDRNEAVEIPKECIRRKKDVEEEQFAEFAKRWALEEQNEQEKKETLDSLEDIMENVMTLADSVVKLTGKIKRGLRKY